MLNRPMDVPEAFPVRKSKKQKEAFRGEVIPYLESLGYSVHVEKGAFGSRNVVAGDPSRARYLLSAHYDTCASLPIPNLITPCNLLPYVLYQLLFIGIIFGTVALLAGFAAWVTGSGLVAFWTFELGIILACYLVIAGPANPSNSNDNTSGVVQVLELARTMPENQRGQVAFLLFDLEEAGLIGSASYAKAHKKEIQNQIILNFDCVGDGDHIRFFLTKKLKKNRDRWQILRKCCGRFGEKTVAIREKGTSFYPSDQANFPYGVGICALRKSPFGLYCGRIHTFRDTILEETNINILRAAIISMISSDAVQ